MFIAATYLSGGSELLLEILGPGIVGGLFLPMLGALPDAMLILGNFKVLIFLRLFYCVVWLTRKCVDALFFFFF